MSHPSQVQTTGDSGMLTQILVTTTQTQTDVAVMKEQMKAVPDHEARIRSLERFKFTVAGGSFFGGLVSGGVGYWLGHVVH